MSLASSRLDLALAFTLARRELRGGMAAMGIFLFCLTMGVAAMAAVGALSTAIERGLDEQGRPLLGGDIEFSLMHRQTDAAESRFLHDAGRVSEIASLRGMARNAGNQTLVEVKAVDGAYPLYGAIDLEPAGPLAAALARNGAGVWGAAVEPGLLTRLGLKIGDRFTLGSLSLEVRALIAREPDRVADGFILAPRLMIARGALDATGLVRPGSLVRWRYRVRLPDGGDKALRQVRRQARDRFPDAGWRIRGRNNAAPNIERFVERVGFFLSLVALTALIVGGVGIANGVKSYLENKRVNIAILKCLGASRDLIFVSSLMQVLMVAALGIALGLGLGGALPFAAALLPTDLMPVPVSASIAWGALALAGLFGLLTTLVFALWPLARARQTPASLLFRGYVPGIARIPWGFAAAIAIAIVVLLVLALVNFPNRSIVAWYADGLIASFALLALIARLVMRLARTHARPRSALARFAVANLYRPGTATPAVMISIGIALSLFVTLGLVDRNIRNELTAAVPERAPAFFFIDVDKDSLAPFTADVAARPGVTEVTAAPMLRGRIIALNGRPVNRLPVSHDGANWALHGDRGLTYAPTLPEGSRLVAGEWWPPDHAGPPLVSMVDEIARGLGLKIGDTVTVNVLGREITARIANLRAVNWRSLQINFVLVFSPDTLAAAPHSNIVTVAMDPSGETALMQAMGARYPAVTAIRVKDALDAVNDLMAKLLAGLAAANALTLVIGIAVLAGAVVTSLAARIHDAVILKTFGATRAQLLAALAMEFALLALITALFAILAGSAGAWVIVVFVLEMPWSFDIWTALATIALALAVTVLAGLASTWSVLGVRPAPLLRMA